MADYRVVATEVLEERGFLSLVEERVVTPVGDELVRHVVRHPGAVVVVPVEGDGALLVRQWRVAARRRLLEIPAGKRDVEGEPPEMTARRELEEEVGRRAGRLVKLAEFYNSPGFCTELTHAYLALDLETLESRHPARAEERDMTVETVAWDDVLGLVMRGELTDAKSIVGLLLARAWLAGEYDGMA